MNIKAIKTRYTLRGKRLTFDNAEKLLNDFGYSVVLYNNPTGDLELERYDLMETAKDKKGFTYCEVVRIVFVDSLQSPEDRLYIICHELGHICMGHLGSNTIAYSNKILLDIEADSFAYKLIRRRRL